MQAPEWQFNAIQGATIDGGAWLRHLDANAELLVRGGRLVRGRGYDSAPRALRRELARAGAILRLRQRCRYHVHAAGVVDPSGRAYLLAGPTGSGKSTLAYAAARLGWRVLGDDGVIVEIRGDRVTALGWHEPLRVSTTLAPEFPELADRRGTVLVGDARQRSAVPMPTCRTARVAAVLWVEQGPDDRLDLVPPADALLELIRQSAWVLISDGRAAAHLEALRRIAIEVPSYRLVHTPAQLRVIDQTLLSTQT
jgi:hypothetical protein